MAESLCQHLKLRIKLLQENKLIFKIKERTNTDNEEKLENPLREIGTFKTKIPFAEFKRVQEAIEEKKMKELGENLGININQSYGRCLKKLIKSYDYQSEVLTPKDYISEMPMYYTVKKIGEGTFASAHVIRKHNEKQKFRLERADVDANEPNLYVLKLITFPKNTSNVLAYSKCQEFSRKSVQFEMLLGQKLSHPNICQFYDAFKTNYFVVLISEFLCLGSIDEIIFPIDKLADHSVIVGKRIKFYTAQLLMVIDYLHDLGIFHGDLSVSNVCIDYRGYLKIIDFGLAVDVTNPYNISLMRVSSLYEEILYLGYTPADFDEKKLIQEITQRIISYDSLHLVDLYMVALCFYEYAIKYLKDNPGAKLWRVSKDRHPEVYIVFWILDPSKATPSASDVLYSDYYADINFTRLLLRDYDLVTELKLDCEAMFTNYMKETNWTLANEDLVFRDDNEYTFKKKNDLEDLKSIYGNKHYRNFHDL